MFSQVKDSIGRSILVVFLIKPGIDLLYFLSISVGPIRLSPTTVFGALMFVWFARYRLRRGSQVAPFSGLLEAFLLLSLVSIFVGIYTGAEVTLVGIINIMLRVLDSYLIYIAAFIAFSRYNYESVAPFVKAIVIGSAVAVFLNVAAIQLGFGGGAKGLGMYAELRERGLYYDPGAMSNVAFFCLVFSVFLFHLIRKRRLPWIIFLSVLILCDLYLILLGKSRAVLVEMLVVGFIYLLLFQRRWGKIAAPFVGTLVLVLAFTVFDFELDELFVRFETEFEAIEEGTQSAGQVGITDTGDISLGGFERLGSNRGIYWAEALTEILNRPFLEFMVGNFETSRAHSDYIDVLSRNGLIGLLLYLAVLGGMFFRIFKQVRRRDVSREDRVVHFIAFTLLSCWILYAIPFRPLAYTTTAWYMWAMIGFSMAASRRRPQTVPAPQRRRQPRGQVAPGGAMQARP